MGLFNQVFNFDHAEMHRDYSVIRRKLYSIREEIEDNLTVAALVSEDFAEVELVEGVLQDRAKQVDFL